MAGYQGYSKSNNAISAEKSGKMNASQLAKALSCSTVAIKKFLNAAEWHHTSKEYNETFYYSEPLLLALAMKGTLEKEVDGTYLATYLEEYSDNLTDEDIDAGNELKNAGGKIERSEAGEILPLEAPVYKLEELPVNAFGDSWIKPRRRKINLPLIVVHYPPNVQDYNSDGGAYQVLDGVHRIAEAVYRQDKTIWCYVGEFVEGSYDFNNQTWK